MLYKARRNEIVDAETGKQLAVVLASNVPRKLANRMAQYAVDRLNADERAAAIKLHQANHGHVWKPMPNTAYRMCDCGAMERAPETEFGSDK